MEIGAGVCQDHVHAFTSVARLLGYSARYVSGYLFMGDMSVQKLLAMLGLKSMLRSLVGSALMFLTLFLPMSAISSLQRVLTTQM